MLSGNFKAALSNLRSSRGRTFLTMFGIIVGISSVITVVSLGEGLKHKIVGQVNQLGSEIITVRPGKLVSGSEGHHDLNLLGFLSTSTLSSKDVESISKLSSLSAVVPINFITNSASYEAKSADNISVLATSPAMPDILRQKVDSGVFFGPADDAQKLAVIGPDVAKQLFGSSNPIGYSIKILNQDFIVRGVLTQTSGGLPSLAQTNFNSAIFLPFGPGKELVGGKDNILQIFARSKDANPDLAVREIHDTIAVNHNEQEDFSVLKQSDLLNLLSDVVDTSTGFITAVAAVSLLVGGIGIMDILLASVSERTREIGLRKAIGATHRQILNQFLIEGLALSIGGGLIGVAVALLVNLGLNLYTGLDPIVTVPIVLIAVGVSLAIGIFFSFAPAIKAARKDPIVALRGE